MQAKHVSALVTGLLAVASWIGPARADEPAWARLDAVGSEGQALGPCPLENTEARVEIAGFVARTTVVQTFSNPFDEPIEAIYTFPLSSDGAVDAMQIRAGDRTVRGQIRLREDAKRLYEDAKRDGKLAALLDQERPNVFTQAIANLMPGTSVEVEIQYVEPLDYADGSFEFSFPMVVGPRFVPGTAVGRSAAGWSADTSEVPDGSRITPPVAPAGVRAGHDVSLQVDLDAGLPILEIESELHEVDVRPTGEARRSIRLRNQREIPNRDFVLRWRVAGEQLESGVLTHRPSGEEDGFATFLLVPPARLEPDRVAPRELVFVVDRSGSQAGKPLAFAKEAMRYAIDHLNARDTFQIVSFSNEVDTLFARPQSVTASTQQRAHAYIERLQANGGTMMANAVREVCATPAPQHRLRIVVFMTDGYVGNDHQVLGMVRDLRGTSRWFPFGTGRSTNRYLLDHMAREGAGEVEYVLFEEDAADAARRFYERISSPVLTDVRIDFEGLDVHDVAPHRLPDLWAHRPVLVHARYRQAGTGQVVLSGRRGGRPWRQALSVTLPERDTRGAPLASMWARAKVTELLARDLAGLQRGTFAADLKRKVEGLGLAHHLLTPFTSFVAVEERVVNENGRSRTVVVPVEVPDGVDRDAALGHPRLARAMAPPAPLVSGAKLRPLGYVEEAVVAGDAADPRIAALPAPEAQALVDWTSEDAQKVTPALRRELERVASNGASVTVRVTLLGEATSEIERRLRRAGLRIVLVRGDELVGEISAGDLRGLLALEPVVAVDAA